jgi:hypothetical protein
MRIEVEDGLLEYMAGNTGAVHLELHDTDDPDRAIEGMRQAANALFSVPHPEEPDESLPSFVSGVTIGARGPTFWFADAGVYDGLLEKVLETVVEV